MVIIKNGEVLTTYGNLKQGETFVYEGGLYMVVNHTDPGVPEITYASVNIKTGNITYRFANGTLVTKVDCVIEIAHLNHD